MAGLAVVAAAAASASTVRGVEKRATASEPPHGRAGPVLGTLAWRRPEEAHEGRHSRSEIWVAEAASSAVRHMQKVPAASRP